MTIFLNHTEVIMDHSNVLNMNLNIFCASSRLSQNSLDYLRAKRNNNNNKKCNNNNNKKLRVKRNNNNNKGNN